MRQPSSKDHVSEKTMFPQQLSGGQTQVDLVELSMNKGKAIC